MPNFFQNWMDSQYSVPFVYSNSTKQPKSIKKDVTGTRGRKYSMDLLDTIFQKFKDAGIPYKQNLALLANIAEESGGNYSVTDGTGKFYGLLQWASDRYSKEKQDSLDKQVDHIIKTINNTTDQKSWTHGGSGSGYKSFKSAYKDYMSEDPDRIVRGVTLGYVRPTGKLDSVKNRKIAYDKLSEIFEEYKEGGSIHIKPENEGKLTNLKKRTGKTEAELWSEGNPSVRKMITFARNARKWKKD